MSDWWIFSFQDPVTLMMKRKAGRGCGIMKKRAWLTATLSSTSCWCLDHSMSWWRLQTGSGKLVFFQEIKHFTDNTELYFLFSGPQFLYWWEMLASESAFMWSVTGQAKHKFRICDMIWFLFYCFVFFLKKITRCSIQVSLVI